MKEHELGEQMLVWLQEEYPDWDIYQEISLGNARKRADIVLVKSDLVWVIELKTSLSLSVIQQAYEWQVDYRGVAVPKVMSKSARKSRRWWGSYMARQMEIDLFEIGETYVDKFSRIMPSIKHKPSYTWQKDKLLNVINTGLTEGFAEAGTKGTYWTPYKQSMIEIREYLRENPGRSVYEIVEDLGKLHYSSERSARSTLLQRLQGIESGWCRVDRDARPYRFYVKENTDE